MYAWAHSTTLCLQSPRLRVSGRAQPQLSNTVVASYLAGEEATHSDDAENVKDSGAHNGPHPHIAFGDEHPWGENKPEH